MEALFQPELAGNERLLWTGRPETHVLFSRGDFFLVPLSFFWGCFALFWEAMALTSGVMVMSLLGIPFVLTAAYFIFGRFAYKSYLKKRTHYAVTDRRVVVLTTGLGRALRAAYIHAVPAVGKSVRRDGVGSLTFGNAPLMAGFYANSGMDFFTGSTGGTDMVSFFDIKEADRVYRLVCDIREGAAR